LAVITDANGFFAGARILAEDSDGFLMKVCITVAPLKKRTDKMSNFDNF
jgi:hypothetical protein